MTLYFGSLPLEWGDYKCALACLVCGCWGLTSGLHMCWASTLPSEWHSQSAGTVLKDTSILYWVSRQLRLREAPSSLLQTTTFVSEWSFSREPLCSVGSWGNRRSRQPFLLDVARQPRVSPGEDGVMPLWTPEHSSQTSADWKRCCFKTCCSVYHTTVYFNIVVIYGIFLGLGWLTDAQVAVVDTHMITYLGLCFPGNALKASAERFTDDPCYLPKREAVVQAARALLAAVTRLLILVDMIDVMCLLQHVSSVSRRWLNLLWHCFHF